VARLQRLRTSQQNRLGPGTPQGPELVFCPIFHLLVNYKVVTGKKKQQSETNPVSLGNLHFAIPAFSHWKEPARSEGLEEIISKLRNMNRLSRSQGSTYCPQFQSERAVSCFSDCRPLGMHWCPDFSRVQTNSRAEVGHFADLRNKTHSLATLRRA